MSEDQAWIVFRSMLGALKYLHELGWYHGDPHEGNMFLFPVHGSLLNRVESTSEQKPGAVGTPLPLEFVVKLGDFDRVTTINPRYPPSSDFSDECRLGRSLYIMLRGIPASMGHLVADEDSGEIPGAVELPPGPQELLKRLCPLGSGNSWSLQEAAGHWWVLGKATNEQ